MKVNFQVKLLPLDREIAMRARSWRNDHRIWRWCRQSDLISDWDQERWFDRQAADPTIKMYAVATELEGAVDVIGVAGLTSIDMLCRRAEFSLYLRPDMHGKGLGQASLGVLLSHGFLNLGLNQVWGESFAGNAALRSFERAGMKVDGLRRQFYFKEGAFQDAVLVSILRSEWEERHGLGSRRADALGSGGGDGEQRVTGSDDLAGREERPRAGADAGEAFDGVSEGVATTALVAAAGAAQSGSKRR